MRTFAVLILTVFSLSSVFGQNTKKVDPIYPKQLSGLIYIEGEDAVATNFSKEAILDYSSSGLRTLLLNRTTGLYQGSPFFAQYVIYVPDGGQYEFWWGGTPPGPKDELKASYASPIQLIVDEGSPVSIYRENVNVVDSYSPTEYWSKYSTSLQLSPGSHTLRIEVSEKRRFDNKYYFSLDALFLLKSNVTDLNPALLPPQFPQKRTSRAIDNPYLTIAQYEAQIQAKPNALEPYIEISKVFSLIGDYSSALKYLTRARVLSPDDPNVLLLTAKNKIWSGENDDGFQFYKSYLDKNPKDLNTWAEAAKIMAWLGKYNDSIELYKKGLSFSPEDLNLTVNLGLTYYWSNRIKEGDQVMSQVWKMMGVDDQEWVNLGSIFTVNGYPSKATEVYAKAVAQFPSLLQFYLLLQDNYAKMGQDSDALKVKKLIVDTFTPSALLTSYLTTFEEKQGLKEKALNDFRTKLKANPDDIKLREMFIEGLFWNGKKNEAIQEYVSILVNYLYRSIGDLEKSNSDLFRTIDELSAGEASLKNSQDLLSAESKELNEAFLAWQTASRTAEQWETASKIKALTDEEQKNQTKANETLDAAQKQLAIAYAAAVSEATRSEKIGAALQSIQPSFESLIRQSASDSERLTKLASPRGWVWDRDGTMIELKTASSHGLALADYLLARIATFERRFKDANKILETQNSEGSLSNWANLSLQSKLWDGQPVFAADLPSPYFSYGPLFKETLKSLTPPQPAAANWNDDIPKKVADLVSDLQKKSAGTVAIQSFVQKQKASLFDALLTKVKIAFYSYDEAMLLLRYQLGDYNIGAENYDEARRQLRKVLLLDPWNTSARFRLGNVSQLIGDWSDAMMQYESVYQTDPKFESVASLHNQVAKQHPEVFSSQVRFYIDTERNVREATLDYKKDINTNFSFDSQLANLNSFGYKSYESNVTSAWFQIPFKWNAFNFKIAPLVGTYFQDASVKQTTTPVSFSQWAASVSPLLKAGLGFGWGYSTPVTIESNWEYAPVIDTLWDRGTAFSQASTDLSLSLFLSLPQPSVLSNVSSRTYFKAAQILNDSNLLLTGVQEINLLFHVADAPWSNLTLGAIGLYELGSQAAPLNGNSDSRYYSPGGNLSAKGSLSFSTWIGVGAGHVLGISARSAIGPLWQNMIRGTATSLLAFDSDARLELSKGDWALFLAVAASGTNDGKDLTYWFGQATLGFQLSVPSYIVP